MRVSSKYRQGIFKPKNPNKFLGSTAFYRSGLELKFMRFFDDNTNVLQWSSERVIVPYISPLDNRVHKYFVDNFVVIKEGDTIRKYLVEIKPSKQTAAPTAKYKKKHHLLYEQRMWHVNNSKWTSAKAFAKERGWEFIILTEKDIS